MNNASHIEKKNQRMGVIISVVLHLVLIGLFLWATVWRAPNPPNPEYGIELNFGMVDSGSGKEPVSSNNQAQPEEESSKETIEETTDNQPSETSAENTATESESSNTEANTTDQSATTQNTNTEVPQEESAAQKSSNTNAPTETKEEKKEDPKPNPKALFPGNNPSQGDGSSNEGDQGNPDGDVDAKALMGPQGGGGGSTLDMAGWIWDRKPNPRDNSQQNGKIVFQIKVDGNGEVISVRVVQTTVSPEVLKIYQDEVSKLTFSRIGGAGKIADVSTGTITFIIRSK